MYWEQQMKGFTSKQGLAGAVFLSVFLTACGGGGSDSPSVGNTTPTVKPPVVTPPVVTPPIVTPPTDGGTKPPVTTPPVDETTPPVINPPTSTVGDKVAISTIKNGNDANAALAGSNKISLARQACGLGGVDYNEELTNISIKHAMYTQHLFSEKNVGGFNAHGEEELVGLESLTGKANPYFAGIDLQARLEDANYSNIAYGTSAENIVHRNHFTPGGMISSPQYSAIDMAKALLAAPYHFRTLMIPSLTQTGTGMVMYTPQKKDPNEWKGYIFVNTSSSDKSSAGKSFKGVFTYPCEGVTDTHTALWNEAPSPVYGTGRNLRTDPIGQPIYISMPEATSIKVSNVKFRDTQRKVDVPINMLDGSTDPYKNTNYELSPNEAFILPITDGFKSCEVGNKKGENCGLYGNTSYTVSYDILVNNSTLQSKSFTFKTGNVNY